MRNDSTALSHLGQYQTSKVRVVAKDMLLYHNIQTSLYDLVRKYQVCSSHSHYVACTHNGKVYEALDDATAWIEIFFLS